MYLSPDAYHKITQKYRSITKEVSAYLNGKDSSGLTIPMYIRDDAEQLKREISMEIGKCEMAKEGLKRPDRLDAYQQMEDDYYSYLSGLDNLI